MLLKRNTEVVGGLWVGREAREFFINVSDSDEDSDYDDDDDDDDTNYGGGVKSARSGGIRVVNPPPPGYKSKTKTILGARDIIYPGPDLEHYIYHHSHLRDFSRKAINQYNHQTGNTYEFVELVEAELVATADESDHIAVTFKARQTDDDDDDDDDDTTVTTSFKAETHSESLLGSYDIDKVVPLHSDSDMTSPSGS